MYTVSGSDAISRDMDNMLFSTNFNKYTSSSQPHLTKPKQIIPSDHLYDYTNPHHHLQQQHRHSSPPPPQQPVVSSLARFRSAPSSFFATLLDDDDDDVANGFSSLLNNNSENELNLKEELVDDHEFPGSGSGSDMVYAAAPNLKRTSSGSGGNSNNLIRQTSSPPGFLSNLVDEIGFGVTSDGGNFRASNRTNMELGSTTNRSNNHMAFSSGQSSHSRFMPQIAENGNEKVAISSQQNGQLSSDHSNRHYLSTIPNDSSFTSLKRNRDGEMKMFSHLSGLDSENSDSKHYNSGLLHQLSLPSTSAEMASIENLLQFQQDNVIPCKIRAKRGFATHPRSIAERVRRTRISERMKKLQELFPNMDKQANTADMLDLAVEFIKDLQKEVQTLNDIRARCTCSSKIKQTSPTA